MESLNSGRRSAREPLLAVERSNCNGGEVIRAERKASGAADVFQRFRAGYSVALTCIAVEGGQDIPLEHSRNQGYAGRYGVVDIAHGGIGDDAG